MKKIVRYVFPLFACAVLAFSLTSCGKITDSKCKCDTFPGATLSFDNATNWHIHGWKDDDIPEGATVEMKGTYKTEKKTITCTGEIKITIKGISDPQKMEVSFKLETQDSAKKKLKDEDGNIWKKI